MDGENLTLEQPIMSSEDLFKGFFDALPPQVLEKFYSILDLTYIISLLILVILIFSAIRKIIQIFAEHKITKSLSRIVASVESINEKLGKSQKPSSLKNKNEKNPKKF